MALVMNECGRIWIGASSSTFPSAVEAALASLFAFSFSDLEIFMMQNPLKEFCISYTLDKHSFIFSPFASNSPWMCPKMT
jgi:hypothetical protein